jgi:hypothetical protein
VAVAAVLIKAAEAAAAESLSFRVDDHSLRHHRRGDAYGYPVDHVVVIHQIHPVGREEVVY